MRCVIAIVGRPNVGKSTLFNRLARKPKALIDDIPGVTRDRNYADIQWDDFYFTLIDTGGLGFEPNNAISLPVQEQTRLAIEESDIIIFLTDGREGLTPLDADLMKLLRPITKPIVYCSNKIDGPRQEENVIDFYRLGIDSWHLLSAQHGRGVSDLMDAVAAIHPTQTPFSEEEDRIKVAVLGRPNVGKSSLVNRILGYDRVIVCSAPGTTRDAIDTPLEYKGQQYTIIDTAGIRRKSRIGFNLEKYCVFEAFRALRRCDVSLLIIDAEAGVTDQDTKIAGQVINRGKACIVVVNKWDLIHKDNATVGSYVKDLRDRMKFLDFAPIVFVSALTGQRTAKILDKALDCFTQFQKRTSTSDLNQFLTRALEEHPLPRHRGRQIKLYYVTQTAIKPPTFVFFTNFPQAIHFSYERYLSNRLRERYGFEGTPLRLLFRGKKAKVNPRG